MPFLARESVPCIKCHDTIAKGEPISWTRGKGAAPGVYHVACPGHMPAAVTFALPEPVAEPVMLTEYDDELPELEPEPLPGTRRWFDDATMEDREYQIVAGSVGCLTLRNFTKLVICYSRHLDQRGIRRLRRFSQKVWARATVQEIEYTDQDYNQLSLFPEPETGETDHSRITQAWRDLFPALQAMPA